MTADPRKYVPLEVLASVLGLPRNWLRSEADTGRLPCLRIGRRRMFNIEAVEGALADRAKDRESEMVGETSDG